MGQLLEDTLGADTVESYLQAELTAPRQLPPEMQRRIELLDSIPFRAILTTNFDMLMIGATPWSADRPFAEVLRPSSELQTGEQYSVDDLVRSHLEEEQQQQAEEGAGTGAGAGAEAGAGAGAGARSSSIVSRFRRPVIKIHGTLDPSPEVVWTRRGYRTLVHGTPGFSSFLKSLLSTCTVLYLGFSFSDGYLNELRSEVLSFLRGAAAVERSLPPQPQAQAHSSSSSSGGGSATAAAVPLARTSTYTSPAPPPIGYAIVHDKSPYEVEFFRRHEGVSILSWRTTVPGRIGKDYSGFDRYLAAIHERTSYAYRVGKILSGKRVLIVEWRPSAPTAPADKDAATTCTASAAAPPPLPLQRAHTASEPRKLRMGDIVPVLQRAVAAYTRALAASGGGCSGGSTASDVPPAPALRAAAPSLERTATPSDGVLDAVGSPADAVACLRAVCDDAIEQDKQHQQQLPYDLVVSVFGEDRSGHNHWFQQLLRGMRGLPFAAHAPVIVYSSPYNAAARRRYVLRSGCAAFADSFSGLIRAISDVLESSSTTAGGETTASDAPSYEYDV